MEEDLQPISVDRVPEKHKALLLGCWETEPLLRITAKLLLEKLEKLR